MKCQDAQQLIREYVDQQSADQQMAPAQFELLTRHFRQCASCGEKLREEQQFRQLLTQLNTNAPVPAPSAGFVDRALRTAAEQDRLSYRDSHRQGFMKGFGSALAAGLVIWIAVTLMPALMDKKAVSDFPVSGSNTISISLQESTDVKLAFRSLKDVQGATITINLSDNLELVGYQNQQTLEWKTDLVAGDNVLTLPIKALKPHQGKIIAQITHNNLQKSIELILNVKNDNKNEPGISGNNKIITPVA